MQRQLILVAGLLLASCVPAGAQTLKTQVLLAQAPPAPTKILVWALPAPFLPNAPLAKQQPTKPVAPPAVFLSPSYEADYSLEGLPLIQVIRTPFLTESRVVALQFGRGHLQLEGVEGTLHMQNPHFGPPGSNPPRSGLANSFDLDGASMVFRFGRDTHTERGLPIWRCLASIGGGSGCSL